MQAISVKAVQAILVAAGLMAALPSHALQGDAKAGEQKNAMCIGCHGIPGYQSSFPQVYKVPKISGQTPQYLTAALDAYRKGDRKHPSMNGVAGSLSDQDIADLAAFYSGHGQGAQSVVPAAAVELPANLKDQLSTCVACHGVNFNQPTDPANPRLAGQHADYLAVALRAYQTEGKHVVGRSNATMAAMAKPLTAAQVKQIAAFLSSLPGDLKTVPQPRTR